MEVLRLVHRVVLPRVVLLVILSMPNPISAYSTMSRSRSRAWGGEDHPKRSNAANCSAAGRRTSTERGEKHHAG
eukprot:2668581-Prymnesium_polylepis.1